MRRERGQCEWFAGCGNQAIVLRSHPTIGQVRICERCNDSLDRMQEQLNAGTAAYVKHRRKYHGEP